MWNWLALSSNSRSWSVWTFLRFSWWKFCRGQQSSDSSWPMSPPPVASRPEPTPPGNWYSKWAGSEHGRLLKLSFVLRWKVAGESGIKTNYSFIDSNAFNANTYVVMANWLEWQNLYFSKRIISPWVGSVVAGGALLAVNILLLFPELLQTEALSSESRTHRLSFSLAATSLGSTGRTDEYMERVWPPCASLFSYTDTD